MSILREVEMSGIKAGDRLTLVHSGNYAGAVIQESALTVVKAMKRYFETSNGARWRFEDGRPYGSPYSSQHVIPFEAAHDKWLADYKLTHQLRRLVEVEYDKLRGWDLDKLKRVAAALNGEGQGR